MVVFRKEKKRGGGGRGWGEMGKGNIKFLSIIARTNSQHLTPIFACTNSALCREIRYTLYIVEPCFIHRMTTILFPTFQQRE